MNRMHAIVTPEMERGFWKKTEKLGNESGCWIFCGCCNEHGYGKMAVNIPRRAEVQAHRLSLHLHGVDVPDGSVVCHKCDTPSCVNPAHLFISDHSGNHADMVSKNRHAKGAAFKRSKLTESDILEIRREYDSAEEKVGVIGRMAEKYGIYPGPMWSIVHRKTWKHLP